MTDEGVAIGDGNRPAAEEALAREQPALQLGRPWLELKVAAALVAGVVVKVFAKTDLGYPALYRGLAYVVFGPRAFSRWPAAFNAFGFGDVPGTLVPWPFVVFAALAIAAAFALHRTWIGRQLFATGRNQEAARFAGVRVARLKTTLFVLSGVLSALAGVILTARLASARADNGQGFVLDVVTAVLLGGVNIFGGEGTIAGVVLAIFVIGVLRNALTLADIAPDTQSTAVGALLILSVAGPTVVRRIRAARAGRRTPPQPVSERKEKQEVST